MAGVEWELVACVGGGLSGSLGSVWAGVEWELGRGGKGGWY